MKVDEDLVHGQARRDHDVLAVDTFRIGAKSPLLHHQIHDVPDIFRGRHDFCGDHGLFNAIDLAGIRQEHRVVHLDHLPALQVHVVDHTGVSCDDVHIVFPAQPFLNDLHVEQPEEPATEAEPQRGTGLSLIHKRGIVQLQFCHTELELFVVCRVDGIDPAEHHGLDLLKSGQRLFAGIFHRGDGVPHFRIGGTLDVGDDIAHLTRLQHIGRLHVRLEHTNFLDLAFQTGAEETQPVAPAQAALEDTHVCHHAPVGIVDGVKDQRGSSFLLFPDRRRHRVHDRLQQRMDPLPRLGGNGKRLLLRDRKDLFQLFTAHFHIRRRKVDLVDDGDDRQIVLHCHVHVGNGLRLNALRGIDHQHGTVTGGKRPAHFVSKVHVTRGINQVQLVCFAIIRLILHADRVGLDGDPALLFQIHGIQQLVMDQIPLFDGMSLLHQAVGKR